MTRIEIAVLFFNLWPPSLHSLVPRKCTFSGGVTGDVLDVHEGSPSRNTVFSKRTRQRGARPREVDEMKFSGRSIVPQPTIGSCRLATIAG